MLLGQFGQGLILAAMGAFLVSAGLCFFQGRRNAFGKPAAWLFTFGAVGLVGAFGALLTLFLNQQYHYRYVFNHLASDHELQYRISGVWAGQEGSFLLWAITSALFGVVAMRYVGHYRRWFTIVYAVFLACISGILAFESPFALMPAIEGQIYALPEGVGMNPSLLNYWMVIHPPTIFLGFGSLTVMFAWSMAALIQKDLSGWITKVRPWAIISLTLVGLGLCMGGFWAYETLGWGGFWMWDPVENTSFVPWVLTAAFIHGIFVQVARKKWHYGNALLAATPFLAFCYGTFLTRSGFLADVSVHSFAQMDRSALQILTGVIIAGATIFLATWGVRVWQARKDNPIPAGKPEKPINREGLYAGAIWLLIFFAVATAFGMSVPFIMALTGQQAAVVEEPLYNRILAFGFVPLIVVMALGPLVSWRGLGFKQLMARINVSLAITIFITGVVAFWTSLERFPTNAEDVSEWPFAVNVPLVPWVLALTGLSVFAIVTNVWRMGELWKRAKPSLGGLITHVGVVATVLGLIFSRGLQQRDELFVMRGSFDNAQELGYAVFALDATDPTFMSRDNRVQFEVTGKYDDFIAEPKLYYTMDSSGELNPTAWPHVERGFLYDVYFTVHPMQFDATEETPFNLGETRSFENLRITYNGLETSGTPGTEGAAFIADLTVETPEVTRNVRPRFVLAGPEGADRPLARINEAYDIQLSRIDPETRMAHLKIYTNEPIFPVEIYYKPLTGLVWLGVGIMTFGGFWSAVYRWNGRRKPKRDIPVNGVKKPEPEREKPDRKAEREEPLTKV
jgi:cytochrome c-type biogenesis protein CcmF